MLNDYKVQEAERQEAAKESNAHYKSVDLPGTRTFGVDADAVRARIEEMKKVKALPNHDTK